jgi:hypothetical protein
VATQILDTSGTVLATNFTTSTPANGTLVLSLTDTNTTAIGVGTYRYWASVTKSSATRTWLAGALTVMQAGWGGTSTSSASLSITTGAATVAISSVPALASSVTLANQNAYFAGTTVESALSELINKFAPSSQELPPDSTMTVARVDVFPTELATGTLTMTTQRQAVVHFQVAREITVNTVAFCGDTTASASLTTGQLGLCFVSNDGHVFPAAKCANDTTIFNVASTLTSKTFDFGSGWPTAITLVPGRWYATTAFLDGGTMPTLVAGPTPRTAIQGVGNSRSRRCSTATTFVDF